MTLSWYGLSSFKITNVGDKVTLITDPFSKNFGLTPPRGAADIVLISRDNADYGNIDGLTGSPLVIKNPGEFDVKDVFVQGIPTVSDGQLTTIYRVEMDDVRLGFLGALAIKEMSDKELEALGDVDVLIIPVGGHGQVVDWETASAIVQQIEPRFVVPCFYSQKGLTLDLDAPDKFLKDLGHDGREEDRLTLRKKDTLIESTQVVVLKAQR